MGTPGQETNLPNVVVIMPLKPKFPLGRTVMTRGVADLMQDRQRYLLSLLRRHHNGDWGCVCDDDKRGNDDALIHGDRLVSAYPIDPTQPSKGFGENTLWIITECDRSVTTALLPSEY